MKLINKIYIYIIFIYIWNYLYFKNIFAWDIENSIIPNNTTNTILNQYEWKDFLFSILEYVKDSIFWLLALITITIFIFIWARLIMARWNPEEFKKALMHFIYAIVWLAVIAISWVAVKLVSSLNF